MASTSTPYIALGDSLTHGMQSMGVAAVSQSCSYPKLIADFLGVTGFAQPQLKGWLPGRAPDGQPDTWVGNPPNIELVLRRAETLLAVQDKAAPNPPSGVSCTVRSPPSPPSSAKPSPTIFTPSKTPAPLILLVGPALARYQNLGVAGFTVQDVSTANYARLRTGLKLSFGGRLAKLARTAIDDATHLFGGDTAHPSLLHALTDGLLAVGQHDFGQRISANLVGAVLGRNSLTALDIARAQQPRLVTLWIGNSDALTTMCNAHIWDGNTPLYTPPDLFRDRFAQLLDAILAFDSQPNVFVATLPSPTASPNLVRDRLGHWKSMLPSAAFLVDAQLLELETLVGEYNAAIRQLAQERAGRVWVVDVHALQERMQRGTRDDAQTTRRVVLHAVRAGLLDREAAQDVINAARAGNLATIRQSQEIANRLDSRSFTAITPLAPEQSGSYLTHRELSTVPTAPNLDAFALRLASGQLYRLTGEYLSADDGGNVTQGGAVSLDAIHLTNTGYAYVAREFLRAIYEANTETSGAILRGLPGAKKTPDQFDATLTRVASEDSLLNGLPRLLPAALDAAGAAADLLGELHYTDAYLTR